jgi:type I restriction enzyme S subunit
MSFPRYPKYKESGVNWLGEIPDHWRVSALKHMVSTPITDGPHETPAFLDEGVPFVSAEAVATGTIDFTKIRGFISASDHQRYSEKYRPRIGDVFMVKSGATTGVTAMVETVIDFNIWSPLAAIRCGNQALPRFVLHFLRSRNFQEGVTLNWSFGTQQNIGMGVIENMVIVVPPPSEQLTIASFLDRETAKIDELIAEQRRLIELLKEKRQAVISHAVTKGLDPNVRMKPSGVEWIGDVPEHWEVMKGALIGRLFGSEQVPEESVCEEGDLPFIKVGSMSLNSFTIGSWDWFVDRSIADQYMPRSDYIVFPKRGAAIFTNKVNIVERPSLIDPNLMGWEIDDKALPKFIAYTLKSRKLYELADVSTVPQINNKHIEPERFPVPPLDEQREIVDFIDSTTAKFDTLTAEAQRAIDLLQERRTALISAAVTGKIDVRGLADIGGR